MSKKEDKDAIEMNSLRSALNIFKVKDELAEEKPLRAEDYSYLKADNRDDAQAS